MAQSGGNSHKGGKSPAEKAADAKRAADKAATEKIISAVRAGELPFHYANGFTILQGNADITVVLQLHGRPVAAMPLSFTMAKTLVHKLGGLVAGLETTVDREFLTIMDIEGAVADPKKD